MATNQLALLPAQDETWKLDERTRAVGRAGLARARLALARPERQPEREAA
jgi:hypothetical protein